MFMGIVLSALCFIYLIQPGDAAAQETNAASPSLSALAGELREGYSYVGKILIYGSYAIPSDSTQNPNNDFQKIPSFTANFSLRPDFYLHFRRLRFIMKPRLTARWSRWEVGSLEGESNSETDSFVNEWLMSLELPEDIFLSYGRENLQWGPSYLLSPSNPFFRDNGRANPWREVAGMDFARLVWVPSPNWSFSLIANLGEGRQKFISEDIEIPQIIWRINELQPGLIEQVNYLFEEFEKTYAFKADYTGYRKYLTFIASYREKDRLRLNGFAGWTVSNALLVYGEASLAQGSKALFPVQLGTVEDADLPVIALSPTRENSYALELLLLLGGSYTFESGSTITAEYVLNTEGYTNNETSLYLELRRQASLAYSVPGQVQDLAGFALTKILDPGLRTLRKHYLMLQYTKPEIRDIINVALRCTLNMEDLSSQFIYTVQVDLSDYTELFFLGTVGLGRENTEFTSSVDSAIMVGLQFTF